MKNFLLLVVASFTTASLLSYGFKGSDNKILTPEWYVSCFTADVRDQF